MLVGVVNCGAWITPNTDLCGRPEEAPSTTPNCRVEAVEPQPAPSNGKGPPPRPHYSVYGNGTRIGEVTSGTLSPSLNYGVGMAYVPADLARTGSEIEIEIRGTKFPATIEKKPLYKKQS